MDKRTSKHNTHSHMVCECEDPVYLSCSTSRPIISCNHQNIGHFIIVRSQSIWILFGAGRSQYFYFFISGTGHKGQICNLQWFLAKCCFHLKFSSDSEHMDHVSWIVLNPFKMLFSSPHVSWIVLCCLMSDPSGKTTIIHGYYFHNSRKKQTHQLYWLRKASWQQEIGENMMRGGHHSLSGLLSGQDQNWFKIEDKYFGNIEKLQPAQDHSKFQAYSGSRVVFQMFWTVHCCDSDDKAAEMWASLWFRWQRSLFRCSLPLWAPLSQRRNSPLFEWTHWPLTTANTILSLDTDHETFLTEILTRCCG